MMTSNNITLWMKLNNLIVTEYDRCCKEAKKTVEAVLLKANRQEKIDLNKSMYNL